MIDKSDIIEWVCTALLAGAVPEAQQVARAEYPFVAQTPASRRYTELQSTQVFLRDGFIDRYSGQRLIFPGILRLLSRRLPVEFPFHPNWKMNKSHIVYYELFPTIDHVVPTARGGQDHETNQVTTSMLRNAAKSHWLLEELGWTLVPSGSLAAWNGLIHTYLHFVEVDPGILQDAYLNRWYRAAVQALAALQADISHADLPRTE